MFLLFHFLCFMFFSGHGYCLCSFHQHSWLISCRHTPVLWMWSSIWLVMFLLFFTITRYWQIICWHLFDRLCSFWQIVYEKSLNLPFVKIYLFMQELIITSVTSVMLYIMASYYRWWNLGDMQWVIRSKLRMLFSINLGVKIFGDEKSAL